MEKLIPLSKVVQFQIIVRKNCVNFGKAGNFLSNLQLNVSGYCFVSKNYDENLNYN